MTYSGRFAVRLRELREKAGLSIAEAGEMIGVSSKTIYTWEDGTRSPHVESFPIIAEVYKLERIGDLLPDK